MMSEFNENVEVLLLFGVNLHFTGCKIITVEEETSLSSRVLNIIQDDPCGVELQTLNEDFSCSCSDESISM